MTPEQIQKLNNVLERLESLETGSNNDSNEIMIDNLIVRTTDVVNSNVNKSTVVGDSGGTVNSFDYPDNFIEIKYKGKLYRIPAYNVQRFV